VSGIGLRLVGCASLATAFCAVSCGSGGGDRRLWHRQIPPADRPGHRRSRDRIPGPLRPGRQTGQWSGRSRRQQDL